MCGLFFAIKKEEFPPQGTGSDKTGKILAQLKHRGPDGHGVWEDARVLMLHTRLKIVDLSDNANQPFVSGDKSLVLVYNGEIYNYKKIRHELQNKGHHFKTGSDTEVLLCAYQEWGESFVGRLAGMFGFVIYDRDTGKTLVYRDRLGIKPLYTVETPEGIFFASEIRPLLNFHRPKLNEAGLWSYFNLRFVQGEQTLFQGVEEIAPGSYRVYQNGKKLIDKKYWDCRDVIPERDGMDHAEFASLFQTVIEEHNIGDTSVGALLSGGIDSASVVASSAKCGHKLDTYTFSTGVEDDELEKAREIATELGLKNTKISIKDSGLGSYRDGLQSLEDPIGDSIILPTMLLTKGVSDYHKVVLTGEGADEVFSGYVHCQVLTLEDKISKVVPNGFWKMGSRLFGLIPQKALEMLFPYPAKLGLSGKRKLQSHLLHMGDGFERYMSIAGVFEDPVSKNVFNEQVRRPVELRDYWDSMGGMDFADKLKRFDLNYWARNYTLHRLEKLSMMYSLEGRVPFFDHRIVEYVLKARAKSLYHFRDPKRAFRNSIAQAGLGLAPEVVIRKKQAFYLPTERVFDAKTIRDGKQLILDNARERGVYNFAELEKLLSKEKLELLDSKQFQCLYNFELWCQEFLDGH